MAIQKTIKMGNFKFKIDVFLETSEKITTFFNVFLLIKIASYHVEYQKVIVKNLISGLEKVCQDLGKKTDTGKAQIIEILVGAIRTQAASLLNQCQRHQDTQNAALKSQIEQELAQFSAAHSQKLLELQSRCSTAFRKIGAHIQNVEAILSGSIANVASTFEAVDNRFKYVDKTILDCFVACVDRMSGWITAIHTQYKGLLVKHWRN